MKDKTKEQFFIKRQEHGHLGELEQLSKNIDQQFPYTVYFSYQYYQEKENMQHMKIRFSKEVLMEYGHYFWDKNLGIVERDLNDTVFIVGYVAARLIRKNLGVISYQRALRFRCEDDALLFLLSKIPSEFKEFLSIEQEKEFWL